jgi:phosphoenolpyruvate---glycerone phosphotransferase subunit DhaL
MTTEALVRVLTPVANEVAELRDELNRLDAAAGDGDLGVTLAAAADALKRAITREHTDLASLLRACGAEIARAAPSTCGTLVATGFLAAARDAGQPPSSPLALLARLVEAASNGIAERGKVALGDRTMLDALAPAAEALRAAEAERLGLETALRHAAEAANAGADRTAELAPRAGRARWLGERSYGHRDAGAAFVAAAFASACRALTSRPTAPQSQRS